MLFSVFERFAPSARCLLALVLVAAAGAGQEGPVTFEFSFSNPGARSLALGGAFAALADDATAAFANPAGLVQLIEPEISVEGRSWSYDIPFVAGGRSLGSATGEGLDTTDQLRFGRSTSDVEGLSYVSLVYPRKRWALAFYRHTLADFQLDSQVNGLFFDVDGETERSEDVVASTSVGVVNTGVAASFEVTSKLSFGLGVARYDSDMRSLSIEYGQDEEAFFEPNPFVTELLDTTYSYTASNDGFVVHAGLLWRPTTRWSVGAFYRQGPELDLRVIETVGAFDDEQPAGTIELDAVTPLQLPDVLGLGVAYRSTDGKWTVGVEWSRVGYSSITDNLSPEIFDPNEIEIADGDELHLGVERIIARFRPVLALRFGAWLDPAHRVGAGPEADLAETAIFRPGSDEVHVSTGIGLVFDRFQIDLGADFSELVDVYALSFVFRF